MWGCVPLYLCFVLAFAIFSALIGDQILAGWTLFAIFVGLSILIFRVHSKDVKHHSRLLSGCCPKCGYDLRGSDANCPE